MSGEVSGVKKIALALAPAAFSLLIVAGAEAGTNAAPKDVFADEQVQCPNGDLAPPPAAFTGRMPRRGSVGLEVLVVADPSALGDAEREVTRAADAFAPHGIRLVPSFRTIPVPDFDGDDRAYMEWLKQQVGGVPPAGFDVVYLALHRPIGVGGRASCVGGVAWDRESFAIGMLTMSGLVGVSIEGYPLPSGPPIPDDGAKVAAHEIGHLLGAHHHFGQCGLGFRADDPAHPCDVMFSAPKQQMGLFFGPVTGPVIRHFAFRYARP